jgi:hypothetical protein
VIPTHPIFEARKCDHLKNPVLLLIMRRAACSTTDNKQQLPED